VQIITTWDHREIVPTEMAWTVLSSGFPTAVNARIVLVMASRDIMHSRARNNKMHNIASIQQTAKVFRVHSF
jgi:hypothetical protein